MEQDWKKATLTLAVAAKYKDAANLTRHFHGGGGGGFTFFARRYDTQV